MPLQGKQLQGVGTGGGSSSTSDFSDWKLLKVADITSTSDAGGLETSKAMSGNEFQFRGSAPSGSNLSNPNDGCLYNFALTDPDTGSAVDPTAGSIVGVEFYLKFGTNVPNAQNEQCNVGVWNGTNGNFGGFKRDNTGQRVAGGTYTAQVVTSHSHSSGNVYLVRVDAMDEDGTSDALIGPVNTVAFDDAGSPAKMKARVTSNAQDLGGTFNLALVFAGDCDVTVYYRLISTPTNPFS